MNLSDTPARRMSQNDFYVAIQGILEHAESEGYSLVWIEEATKDALIEFLEEKERQKS